MSAYSSGFFTPLPFTSESIPPQVIYYPVEPVMTASGEVVTLESGDIVTHLI